MIDTATTNDAATFTFDLTSLEGVSEKHRADLTASGIALQVAQARQYATVSKESHAAMYLENGWKNLASQLENGDALEVPLWTVNGTTLFPQLKPDAPRPVRGQHKDVVPKYVTPNDEGLRVDVNPLIRERIGGREPLWITEGCKKADSAVSRRLCCVALLGVFGWRGRNKLGGVTVLADWESVNLKERDVFLCFDSDAVTKPQVKAAQRRLATFLTSKGARVHIVTLRPGPNGAKTGLDDHFVRGGDVKGLVALSKPFAEAPPDTRVRPALLTGSDIVAEPIHWLWKNRIARGVLNLIFGPPSAGKGLSVADFVACLTRGLPLPTEPADLRRVPVDVIIIAPEEQIKQALTPRYIVAGADMARVHFLQGVFIGDDEDVLIHFDATLHVDALRVALADKPEAKLIVVDPVTATFDLGNRQHVNSAVRRALRPLADLADEYDVATLMVLHPNKDANPAVMLHMVSGSSAWGEVARTAHLVLRPQEDGEDHYFASLQKNLTGRVPVLRFTVATVPFEFTERDDDGVPIIQDVPKAEWHGVAEGVTLESLTAPKSSDRATKAETLEDVLFDLTAPNRRGDPSSEDVLAEAARRGVAVSPSTLKRVLAKNRVTWECYKETGSDSGPWRIRPLF